MPESHDSFWSALPMRPWCDLLAEEWGGYQPPVTVHLPIQPAHSPDLVHVGSALHACRRRIVPNLDAGDTPAVQAAGEMETLLVQFALGSPPAVPDFRRSILSLEEGRYPLAHAEYYVIDGLLYSFDYFSSPLPDSAQTLLWITVSVTNEKDKSQPAHVWTKVNFPRESDVFDYHYNPYFWDASKYMPCEKVRFVNSGILYCGKPIGKVEPGSFSVEWVDSRDFSDADYGTPSFDFNTPPPALRYRNVRDALHLHTELQAGEAQSFRLAFLVDYEAATMADRADLEQADADACRRMARLHFEQLATATTARLTGMGQWDEIFAHLPISIQQLMIDFPDVPGWVPTQGGTSERHFVWVGEVLFELLPLLPLGHFEPVRQALEYIFQFQDSGHPPRGRLTTTEGAIGTSGPKWLNSTGSALAVAADYYRYSHDAEFLAAFLPRILKALRWIVGELRATRQLLPNGVRPLYYGLMPFGCATDGDIGYVIAFTDAYTFFGFEKAVLMLEQTGYAQAAEFREELEQYREAIAAAVAGLARPDGFIDRKIVTHAPDEDLYAPFDQTCGAFHLVAGNALDAESALFRRYVAWFERNLGDNLFGGDMDRETKYMIISEHIWQDIYLRLGEWKKAFAVAQIALRYGMTQDTHQAQERFRLSDPTFCPWQPNASGNGRILDMLRKSFYFEHAGTVTLLGGIPFAWLRRYGQITLSNLHTPQGIVNLETSMQDDDRCAIRLRADSPRALPRQLRLPEHFQVVAEALTILPGGDYRPGQGAVEVRFTVGERR